MGGSGVQRPLMLAKYLKEMGWEPIVLAPNPGMYHTFDESLEKQVVDLGIRVERVEAKTLFQIGSSKSRKVKNSRWKSRLLKWITSWFFLPDNKKGWIEPAVKKAESIIESEKIKIIFATSPPQSNLLIAGRIKQKAATPVVMDLRDEWLDSQWIKYPTRWHYRKMLRMEKTTLAMADAVTVVNERYKRSLESRYGESIPMIKTIPNGYDEELFTQLSPAGAPGKFTIIHSGKFYEDIQPYSFLRALKWALDDSPELANNLDVQFQGGLSEDHWKVINKLGLKSIITDFGYVNHTRAAGNLLNADLLFLTLPNRKEMESVTPGKLFEYMGTQKPILGFLPDGVSTSILKLYDCGLIVEPSNIKQGSEAILKLYEMWKKGKLPVADKAFVKQFSRSETAKEFSKLFEKILS